MNSRRQVFALAGLLTLTAITGGVAVAGMTHGAGRPAATPAGVQVVQTQGPAIPVGHEPGEVD